MPCSFRLLCALSFTIGCATSTPTNPSGSGGAGGSGGVGGIGSTGGAGDAGGTGGGGAATGGTGGTGGMAVSNRVAAAQWCERLAQIQCAAEALCCTDAQHKFATVADCESSQRSICETNFRVATIGADPRVAYSLDGAETSLATFESLTLRCDVDAARFGASPDGLITMFAGTKASGESCTPTSMTDFAAGASCTRGFTCIPTSSLLLIWNCSARSGSGGPCYADVNCNPELHCSAPETRSTCVANLSDGAGCSRATECNSLFCEAGRCVPATVDTGYCFKR